MSAADHEGVTAMGIVLLPQTARKPDKYMQQPFSETGNKQSKTVIPEGRETKETNPLTAQ